MNKGITNSFFVIDLRALYTITQGPVNNVGAMVKNLDNLVV